MMISVALLLASGLAAGGEDAPAPPPAPAKKICRPMQLTGSIMPARPLCKTKAEWEAFDRGNAYKVKDINDPVRRGWSLSQSGE